MLAQGAYIVRRQLIALVNIAADLADPTGFFLRSGRRLGLDMVEIVLIGHAGHVVQILRLGQLCHKQGVAAPIIGLQYLAGQHRVTILRDIAQTVLCTAIVRNIGKLVGFPAGAEAELPEHLKGRILIQHGYVKHAGALDDIVSVIGLVHRDLDPLGAIRQQGSCIDDNKNCI